MADASHYSEAIPNPGLKHRHKVGMLLSSTPTLLPRNSTDRCWGEHVDGFSKPQWVAILEQVLAESPLGHGHGLAETDRRLIRNQRSLLDTSHLA